MAIRNATARAALGFSSSRSRRETGAGGFLRYGLAMIAQAVTAVMRLFAFALDGLAGNNERPKRIHYGWLCRSRGLFPMLFPSPTLYAPFFSCRTLLASILVVGTIISQEVAAAVFSDPPATPAQGGYKVERTTSLSLDQLKKRLKKFSIRIICWNPADQKAVIKVNNPATLSREQWRKVISESFANKLIVVVSLFISPAVARVNL